MSRPFLVAVFALALLIPASAACSAPKSSTLKTETHSFRVTLALDSSSLGKRKASITLARADGGVVSVDRVTIIPKMRKMNMAGRQVEASKIKDDEYVAEGDFFVMLGDWELDIQIAWPDGTEVAAFTVAAQP